MRRQSSWRPPSGCSENLMATATERTAETVELLQALIRKLILLLMDMLNFLVV